MKKPSFSAAYIMLSLALFMAAVSFYLNHNKLNVQNDNKSKLTLEKVEEKAEQKVSGFKAVMEKNLANQEKIAIAQTASDNVLTQDRSFTELEIKEMTEEKFIDLLKDTQRRLPKISDIKKLPPGVLHRTPEIIIQAGRDLGVLKEVLKVHESYERDAFPFYKNCAKNAEGPTPLRALCLTNLIEIKKKNGENLNLKEY